VLLIIVLRNSNAPTVTGALAREEKRRSNTPKAPKGADEPGFARFWEAWPSGERKAARKQCADKWAAQGCEVIAETVLAAVAAAKDSATWRKNGGEFIPAPLVWLNQRRWESIDARDSGLMAGTV
jgi:hypothetical protein